MILQRMGNKRALTKEIVKNFPEHSIYIEPFFGAGGIFFWKEKVQYNFLNDLDDEVYNLFKVIKEKPQQFENLLRIAPKNRGLFSYWKNNTEKHSVWRAVRFVYMSNFSFMSGGETLKVGTSNCKKLTLRRIKQTLDMLEDTIFDNKNYDEFLSGISLRENKGKNKIFIYCDPPYVKTAQKYNTPKWRAEDLDKLLKFLVNFGEKFAVSEFDTEEVLEAAEKYRLKVIDVRIRRNF